MLPGQSVAIVAFGGEFPDSPNLDRYWENIVNNVNTARTPPQGRWLLDPERTYDPEVGKADKVYSSKACFLSDGTDKDDIPGLELDREFVAALDPMFRLLLRVGQQTINAEQCPKINRSRAGIIIGNLALPSEKSSQLARRLLGRAFTEQLSDTPLSVTEEPVAAVNQYVAGLPAAVLARAIGFEGTCYTVDAACASSLYAIKLAADELLSGRADVMLAGGLSRPDSLYTQMGFSQLRALSPTGTCSPFDKNGNGLVVGEGCGLVLLKRTEDAVRDGDQIHAVIRAIGLSNDLEGNLLAPATEGQLRAMRAAYKSAGWSPTDVDLIECHATGTPVGDAVEFTSLKSLWQGAQWRSGQCVIGSVKANIGHLLTAAGSAALIKTLLALKHQILPPTVNYSDPAAGVDIDDSPFRILNRPARWERSGNRRRRAAISAFGFGGINAHLLLEEWRPEQKSRRAVASHPAFQQKTEPIAIVGMGSHFGPWDSLDKFRARVFGEKSSLKPQTPTSWWGLEKTRWFKDAGLSEVPFNGYFIPAVSARPGEFRIPPKEQEEMLPRQLLMLKVAAAALADAGVGKDDLLFTGVYIGCGLDLNATNFSFRWGMENYAQTWARELGLELNSDELNNWIAELREAAGPALTANRTMGALGSVVASRIAKNFRIGGPSFTLSSEENSGLRALEVAIHSLQEGAINRAIVGAVDLAGDLRNVLSRHSLHPWSSSGELSAFSEQADGSLIGEGAAALVLKRLADAEQDGDQIYAVIRGLGTAIGGNCEGTVAPAETYAKAVKSACTSARTDAGRISYIESEGCGIPEFDQLEARELERFLATSPKKDLCRVGSVKADIGHAGNAAGLASLVKTALCLNQRILPPLRNPAAEDRQWGRCYAPNEAQYWLEDRAAGPRQALVGALGWDGSCSQVVLEEYRGRSRRQQPAVRPLGALPEGLFVLEGANAEDLLKAMERLTGFVTTSQVTGIDDLARHWYAQNPLQPQAARCISFIADSSTTLIAQLDFAVQALQEDPEQEIGGPKAHPQISASLRDRIFYSSKPLSGSGKLAFIFPGSGNHFAGMGSELSARWPQIYREQESGSRYLKGQYLPDLFRRKQLTPELHEDHNALVIAHVALCTALHDLVRSFGIQPQMISGYSLGESSGLFSSHTWSDRDGMLQRLRESTLFTRDLAGECRAAQRVWGLRPDEKVDWRLGIVDVPADQVREKLAGRKQVYLLIVNSYREVVIGGQHEQVEALVSDLGCHFIPLQGVTTVHCEVTKAVANAYRNLHKFPVSPPRTIDFYSCALGRKYPVTSDNAADVILAQALDTIDYPRVVEQLYTDGARIFLEVGPGSSCSRMIGSILEDRPHMARSFCAPGQDATSQLLRLFGHCLAQRVTVDLAPLYDGKLPEDLSQDGKGPRINTRIGSTDFAPTGIPKKSIVELGKDDIPKVIHEDYLPLQSVQNVQLNQVQETADPLLGTFERNLHQRFDAHEAYLKFSRQMHEALTTTISQQMQLLQQLSSDGASLSGFVTAQPDTMPDVTFQPVSSPVVQSVPITQAVTHEVAFERDMCMEFAIGSVAKMLGPEFAEADTFPTRVRLPDEPLMLVDRIISLEGEPRSMTHGRVVTEHDVTADRWYLDGGRIPTCVAVEAGQADLFLSGFLGIDFITRGKAVYRLLDAVVTFHRSLPVVGDVIHYDIKIDHFFRQDQTYLFRFNFEATVNGEPLMSMRNGCAGFFSAEELAAGQGIVHTKLDLMPQPGKRPDDWRDLIPLKQEAYNEAQINALYAGNIGKCFGPAFAALPLKHPYTMPGGKLKLVDRVVKLDPQGGRYALGQITAEMDIHPDDWFLTCHFVDDRVMPGTLMYECCMHTLRIYLLRMGWIGEEGETWCEPIPGVNSGLKCRGQVIETTKTVTYQVSIKELGYRPEPYAIVDALMYADGKAIVEIPDMSIQLAGLTREKVEALWNGTVPAGGLSRDFTAQGTKTEGQSPVGDSPRSQLSPTGKPILYDTDRITAFAIGYPSDAFGEPYRVFDSERKIARLPGPPFQFLDRIVELNGEPWKLVEGVTVQAEYDVPPDAWYFAAGRQQTMPFSVLLEIGLQPCGWLAAYLGSALTSATDLSFRNLDGNAVQYRPVTPESGTLTIDVKITRIASSGGMIIQSYDFLVSDSQGKVYEGDTVFGFFSAQSLAQQVGVRGAQPYQPDLVESGRGERFAYPDAAPFPETKMRMIDEIDLFIADGGPQGLGYIRGLKHVDPDEWFFKAHFYQDPVCPGSLGLESFLQLLKVAAVKHWGARTDTQFETVALGERHKWNYRGQIIPSNKQVVIEAVITSVDDEQKLLKANGFLSVDGKVIYQMTDFSLKLQD
ncbi:MAG: type I polyketide synthase [Desulfuromonas sp.]|nr:MAG: type I polyketide synthase [Desulfuromonas sp.]